ncbi:MFS transporter [Methylovirgula sp. 4M-Z18]|uniref:MFS transporter n=1 Tax=Methylovirgula sp. 4M-Z18 TaxID=2293567 RepID=UPI0018F5CA5E
MKLRPGAFLHGLPPAKLLALLYAALFLAPGVTQPFLPAWLGARGLTDGQIGLVIATPLLMRILATPPVTLFAERKKSVALALLLCSIATAAGYLTLGFGHGFGVIILLIAAISIAQGPIQSLNDALTLRVVQESRRTTGPRLDYGRIRVWGSIAFVLASLMAGRLLQFIPVTGVSWMIAAGAIIGAFVTWEYSGVAPPEAVLRPARTKSQMYIGRPWLVFGIIASSAAIQASHGLLYTFGPKHWGANGIPSQEVGMLWALGVITEIMMFAFGGKLIRSQWSASILLGCGGFAATMRWLSLAFDPSATLLIFVQAMHGLTFCATHFSTQFLLSLFVPSDLAARVQGWYSAAVAAGLAALTALSGVLYAGLGERAYWVMALVSLSGLVGAVLVNAKLSVRTSA